MLKAALAKTVSRSLKLVPRQPTAVPQAALFVLALHLGFFSMYSLVMGSLGETMALHRLAALRWSLLTFLCTLLLLAWNPLLARLRSRTPARRSRLGSWGLYLGTFVLLAGSAALLRSALAPWALDTSLAPRLFAQFAAQFFFPCLAALAGFEFFFARRRAHLHWLDVTRRLERDQERLRLDLVALDDRLRRDASLHLHGEVQSRLLMACTLLLRAQAAPDDEKAARCAKDACAQLDDLRANSLPQTRELLETTESDHPFSQLVTCLARRFEVVVPVELSIAPEALDRETHLSPDLRRAAHTLLEEAFLNACRHGRPSRIRVRLAAFGRDDPLRLVIEDDGRGFEPEAASKGLGLSYLRDEFEREGGRLEIASRAGSGTRLTMHLPLQTPLAGAHP